MLDCTAHTATHTPPRWEARLAAVLVFAASLVMWLGIPPAWIWMLSTVGGSTTAYVLVLLGLPVALAVWGQVLTRLDRLYGRAVAERDQSGSMASALTTSLTIAFLVALAVAIVWIALGGVASTGHSFGPFPD